MRLKSSSFAAFALAGSALLVTLPAQAQLAGCGSTMADGRISNWLSQGATYTCQVGDKIYSDFETDIAPMAFLSIAENGGTQHTLSVNSAGTLSPGTFLKYRITTTLPDFTLKTFQTDLLGAVAPNTGTDSVTWSNADPLVTMPINLALTGPSMSGIRDFIPGTTTTYVSHVLANTNTFTGITDTVTQTPGPLPILGAGAAFGFSRKLRRRIKSIV